MQSSVPTTGGGSAKAGLALGALGVVFGDIGTSPLYTIRECLAVLPPGEHSQAVLGVLSLVFWAVTVPIMSLLCGGLFLVGKPKSLHRMKSARSAPTG